MYRYRTIVTGQTFNAHQEFLQMLHGKLNRLQDVGSHEDYDFVIAFCPIISRIGTDLEAAFQKIPNGRPIVLVVLHHTNNPDHYAPETSGKVNNPDVIVTVDCLFHETVRGLLASRQNDAALLKVLNHLPVKINHRLGPQTPSDTQERTAGTCNIFNFFLQVLIAILVILRQLRNACHWILRSCSDPAARTPSSLNEPLLAEV